MSCGFGGFRVIGSFLDHLEENMSIMCAPHLQLLDGGAAELHLLGGLPLFLGENAVKPQLATESAFTWLWGPPVERKMV